MTVSLTPAQVETLADSIDERYRALVLVAAYGGLRIGELAGLRRSRVDILNARVNVAEVVVEVSGQLTYGQPKTRAGRRSVTLPRSVMTVLNDHLATFTTAGSRFIRFPSSRGRPDPGATMAAAFLDPSHHQGRTQTPSTS